jgi:membrane-associated phospholipid phosphatase
VFVISISGAGLYGQSVPTEKDFLVASAGVGIATWIELYAKEHYTPSTPRFGRPNSFDEKMRNILYLGPEKQSAAEKMSDKLIYSVSISSLIWAPLLTEEWERSLLINMEVFALNGIATNLTKILVGRERPYHHYGTRSSMGAKDNASFISGHSSVAFSQAVTNGILLSEAYPEQEALIWASLIAAASGTAYLRVAGDMHYFTDVLFGAGVGSLIAWTITQYELKRFEESDDTGTKFLIKMEIPLG